MRDPGAFAPVDIAGTTYIDGGVHSVHHLDLLAGESYDLVVVSAPMASSTLLVHPQPGATMRQYISRELRREAAAVKRVGSPVVLLSPDARAQRAMGPRPMDPGSRATVAGYVKDAYTARLRDDRGLRTSLAAAGSVSRCGPHPVRASSGAGLIRCGPHPVLVSSGAGLIRCGPSAPAGPEPTSGM